MYEESFVELKKLNCYKCPKVKVITQFWKRTCRSRSLFYSLTNAFHSTILNIEANNISCTEVNSAITELKDQLLQARLQENFVPLMVSNWLNIL